MFESAISLISADNSSCVHGMQVFYIADAFCHVGRITYRRKMFSSPDHLSSSSPSSLSISHCPRYVMEHCKVVLSWVWYFLVVSYFVVNIKKKKRCVNTFVEADKNKDDISV